MNMDDQFLMSKAPVLAQAVPMGDHMHGDMSYQMNSGLGGDNLSWANDTIDRSTSLFSQLDSMLSAVQTESSALDGMREKVKELDQLRVQLSAITKRLLESDQANLTLKSSLFQLQEAFNEMRRAKQEVESTVVPLRQELNRTKEMYSKERLARLSAQQETR